jgi:putative endonuclease
LPWIVYILECADKTLYTGITNDIENRLAKHAKGIGAKYTRGRAPYKVVYTELYRTKGRALKREAEIKSLGRNQKLKLAAIWYAPDSMLSHNDASGIFSHMNKKPVENLAKAIALACVRNGFLENLHCGQGARSQTGDYTDVKVVTPDRDIAWNDLSRIDDDEMKRLMQEIVNKLYTVLLNIEDPEFMSALMELSNRYTARGDRPKELDNFVLPKRKPTKKPAAKKLVKGKP